MMFDFKAFLTRKSLKHKEAAELLGCSSGNIGMMASGKSKPSYELILKLIDNGITLEELFDSKYSELLQMNSSVVPSKPSKKEIMDGVREALADMLKASDNL